MMAYISSYCCTYTEEEEVVVQEAEKTKKTYGDEMQDMENVAELELPQWCRK